MNDGTARQPKRPKPWLPLVLALAGLVCVAPIAAAKIWSKPLLKWGISKECVPLVKLALLCDPAIADHCETRIGGYIVSYYSPILEAAKKNNFALCETLLLAGADSQGRSPVSSGMNAFEQALHNKNLNLIELFAKKDKCIDLNKKMCDIISRSPSDPETKKIISILLKYDGRDSFTFCNTSEEDLLFLVVEADNFELAKLLLEHGANPRFALRHLVGERALSHAEDFAQGRMLRLLAEHAGRTDLFWIYPPAAPGAASPSE